MGLSLRQTLFASIATAALSVSSASYSQSADVLTQADNDNITQTIEQREDQLKALSQRIFDAQEAQSQSRQRLRDNIVIGDYFNQTIPVVIAALKSADEGITDPEAIANLAIDLINNGDVPRLANGDPTPEFAPYVTQDVFKQAALIDRAIVMALYFHPDDHAQEELATIMVAELLDKASEGISDPERLIAQAINDGLHAMDPHSRFIPAEAVQDMMNDTRGTFSGIGANVSTDHTPEELEQRQDAINAFLDQYRDEDGNIREDLSEAEINEINEQYQQLFPQLTIKEGMRIERLMADDAPAALAGVQAGDIVTHVDGTPTAGLTTSDVVEMIVGPKGTDVQLTIEREGEDNTLSITVTRGEVVVSPVTHRMVDGNVGYIHAEQFNDQTDRFVDVAIRELTAQGAQSFILDLRNNPGGLLNQADELANNFIEGEPGVHRFSADDIRARNTIISQRTNEGKEATHYARPGVETDLPLVVLINGGSASASEVVAGVLQDYGRATVIGTQSFGKGSGQSVLPLDVDRDGTPDGMGAFTSFLYYVGRGEGHNIQGVGITPDIRLSDEFRSVAIGGRTEAGLSATLARPEDGNYNRQSEAVCSPVITEVQIEINEDFQFPNGEIDPWIACAVAHLRGETSTPHIQIAPIVQDAPALELDLQ